MPSGPENLIDRYGIKASYGPLDVGVRVEVPSVIMDPVTRINRDPKFHIITRRYDDFVRTFCTNPGGFVVKEEYQEFIATNGHSMTDRRSENTNFAFLVRLELTKPVENTTAYGMSIAKLVTTIGGRRPVIQRLGDLHRGRRSTEERIARNPVRNTLKDVTPGDISMALPQRIVMDIIEGLEILNQIVPGVNADSTLLYAPEIKFYAREIEVDRSLQTSIRGLYAAGDGAGLSRGIVTAAATGILAGRGIASALTIEDRVDPSRALPNLDRTFDNSQSVRLAVQARSQPSKRLCGCSWLSIPMKKRADDIKKKSDHTNKGSVDAKNTDQDKSAAKDTEELGGEEVLRIPPMYWYLGLLAIMLFSIYLRAVLPWKAVFVGNNTVMFSSESDAWYNMMLAKSTVLNLHRTFYDPLTNFPYGTPIHFGPFDSWGITIVILHMSAWAAPPYTQWMLLGPSGRS